MKTSLFDHPAFQATIPGDKRIFLDNMLKHFTSEIIGSESVFFHLEVDTERMNCDVEVLRKLSR